MWRLHWDASGVSFDPDTWRECLRVLKPGGVVLDPFAGSGTTLEAASLEGFDAVGIEASPEYLPLIEQRLGVA